MTSEITGRARLGRRTKDLVKRLGPQDVAIVDHADIDRVSAEELAESGVRAVINVSRSSTGRYPNLEVVDWNAAVTTDPGLVYSDGIHLTPAGQVAMAALVRERVDAYIASTRPPPAAPSSTPTSAPAPVAPAEPEAAPDAGAPGSGLGLAIVSAIAEGHHGHVDLASVPGVGTTVVLDLPVRPVAAMAPPAAIGGVP